MKLTKKKKGELRRHLFSALITFISAFLLFISIQLTTDAVSSVSALEALIGGALMSGFRALIKILNEELVLSK